MTARGQSVHNVLSVTPVTPLARFDPSRLPPYGPGGGNESTGFLESRCVVSLFFEHGRICSVVNGAALRLHTRSHTRNAFRTDDACRHERRADNSIATNGSHLWVFFRKIRAPPLSKNR